VGQRRDFKFGRQIGPRSQHMDYKTSLKGVWLRHVTSF